MKKIIIIVLAVPIQAWAMQSNTNVMLTKSAVNNVIEIDSDSEASVEEVTTHQPVRMSNVIENTITPRGARINDSIRLLNTRIAPLKGSIANNVMQPFTTWFGAINYVNQHALSNKFTCPSCNKIFTSVGRAAGCFLKHFNQNIFACEKCNSYNDTLDLYYSHKKTCNPIPISVPSTPLPTYAIDNGASRAKNLVDQKVAQIDCCGLSLGSWARGLNHVALAHKRAQTLFTCSKCNKLFDSAQNALACVVKHDDASIFTCPNCMVDCVLHDAFLKHVCPLIKNEIKSEPTTNSMMQNDPYNETVVTNSPHSISSLPDVQQYYNSPMPVTPLTAMLYGSVNTPDSGYISSPLSNQSSAVSDGVDTQEPVAQGNQEPSLVFDPTKSVEDNVKILRNIIKKRISDNRYNCCGHNGIDWDSFCEHVRKAHSPEINKIQCPLCNKVLPNYYFGYHHIATHTHKSLFSCPLECVNRKAPHQRLADQRENGDYLIAHFKTCFKKKYNLQSTNQFVCPFCRKNQFSNKSNYERHVESCKTKTQQGIDQDSVHDYDPVTPEFGTINTPEYAFALDNESVMDANFQRVTNPVYDYLGVHESSPDFFNYYSSPDVDMPSDQFNHFPIPSQIYEDNNTNVVSNTPVVIDSNNTNQQTTGPHVSDPVLNSSTKKDTGKELKIISYTDVQKRKRTRRSNVSEPAKQPVVYEGFTFDAQGSWDYNLSVINNLIAARIAAKSFACCALKSLTWQQFCDHQKEKHKKLIDGSNKVVCSICDKSYRTASVTHEHTASHQHPGLFKCPVCAHENKSSLSEYKDNLLKHFRKCFADKYPSANNDFPAELHKNNTPEQQMSVSINEQHNPGFEPVTNQQYYSPTQNNTQTISNPLFNYGDQTNYYELNDVLPDSEHNRSPQLLGAANAEIEHNLSARNNQMIGTTTSYNNVMLQYGGINATDTTFVNQSTQQHALPILGQQQNLKKRKAHEITITQFQGKKKKLRGGVEKLNIAYPMVIEDHTFDKEGDWDHNRAVLHKLLAARHAANTYSCCELKDLSWENFCAHQKDKHRKLVNESHLTVCPDCGKSFTIEAWTHDHSATHQYPKLFSCPVCTQNNCETTYDHKQLLVEHFKACFYKNYVAEQPMSDEVSSEEDSDEDYVNYGK